MGIRRVSSRAVPSQHSGERNSEHGTDSHAMHGDAARSYRSLGSQRVAPFGHCRHIKWFAPSRLPMRPDVSSRSTSQGRSMEGGIISGREAERSKDLGVDVVEGVRVATGLLGKPMGGRLGDAWTCIAAFQNGNCTSYGKREKQGRRVNGVGRKSHGCAGQQRTYSLKISSGCGGQPLCA